MLFLMFFVLQFHTSATGTALLSEKSLRNFTNSIEKCTTDQTEHHTQQQETEDLITILPDTEIQLATKTHTLITTIPPPLFFSVPRRQRMKSRQTANVSVKGGAPDEHRQTSDCKKKRTHHGGASAQRQIKSHGPSRQSRQGARLGRVHVHPCCRLRHERLSPQDTNSGCSACSARTGSDRERLHDGHNVGAHYTGW